MAIVSFRAGPPTILYPVLNTTALPSLVTITPTASALTLVTETNNSLQTPLSQGVAYTFILALVGKDNTTDGYSVDQGSQATASVTLTGLQNAIQIKVPLASWPANYQYAQFVGVFMAAGAGNYQFCKAVPIVQNVDTANDFYTIVTMQPLSAATTFTAALLQSTTNPTNIRDLGDRNPTGVTWTALSPTTQDIVITFEAGAKVTFSPNNSADFSAITARPMSVAFQTELNDQNSQVQATAGDYWSGVTADGHTITEASFAINTAQVVVKGNRALMIVMPQDPNTGIGETVLFCSLQLQNQEEVALAWSKSNQTPVSFKFQPAPVDALFNNQPTVYTRSRK